MVGLAAIIMISVKPGVSYAFSLFDTDFFNKNKVLEDVDVKHVGGRQKIGVYFTVPLQLQKKRIKLTGKTIKIPVEIHPENVNGDTESGNSNIIWQPTKDVPLDQVSYKGSIFGESYLILDFIRPVSVTVYRGRDNKAIVVEIDEKGFEKEGRYVVNLLATRKRIHVEDFAILRQFKGGRLYVVSKKQDGKSLYLLKLGDYQTQKEAETVAADIQKFYKGAFVTGKKGRVFSAQTSKVSPKKEKQITKKQKAKKIFKPNALGDEKLALVMTKARQAIAKKQLDKAVNFLNVILQTEENKYSQEALELLGVVRERRGQAAHAAAEYEKYLKRYPEGEGSERVRQRLLVLTTASSDVPESLEEVRKTVREESTPMDLNGGLSQFYRKTSDENADIFTFLDVTGKKRFRGWDTRTQITGSQTTGVSGATDTSYSLSELYIDASQRARNIAFKVGRQRQNNSGVFGRFDGVAFSYFDANDRKYNFLVGKPVESSSDNFVNKDKTFFAISTDLLLLNDTVDMNAYLFNQSVNGINDRRAAGVESSFFREDLTMFSLLDYDISYSEINIFLASGNWNQSEDTTYHFSYDLRKNPFLTTSSALQNQTASSIDELRLTLNESAIRQLALDSTSTNKAYNLGVSHSLNQRTRVRGDFTFSTEDISQISATSSTTATLSTTNNNYFYSFQIIQDNFFKKNDISILLLNYSDTDTAKSYRVGASSRFPLSPKLRIISQLQLSVEDNKNSAGGTTLRPDIQLEYRFQRNLTFELESNIDLLNNNPQVGAGNLENFFFSAGYRWIF